MTPKTPIVPDTVVKVSIHGITSQMNRFRCLAVRKHGGRTTAETRQQLEQIRVQLQLLDANFDVVTADGAMDIFHVKEYFVSLGQGQRLLMSQAVALLQFVSRHSCSECCIVQRATTSQKLLAARLNYMMLLHVHKE